MSTEIPTSEARHPDEEAVRRAKAEIQTLVDEVYTLSRSDIEPTEFYQALLDRSVSALAAVGGVVWTFEEGQAPKLEYQINLQQTGLIGDETAQVQHGRLLTQVARKGEPTLAPPYSGGSDGEGPAAGSNPTPFLLVMAPIRTDRGVDGMVEVFQRTGARPNTQKGYLRFLSQVCELAGEYLKTRRLRHFVDKQSLWEQLESFTVLVHQKLDSRETAYTIANEGRRLIGCDRVTVVLRKGGKYVVEAISGQDTFDKRSNAVRLLRNLAGTIAKSGEDLWYAGDTGDLSPQVEKAVNAYVDESHTKQLAVLPLREEDPHKDDKSRPKRRENMLGAVVIEQLVDSRPPEGLLQRVDVVRKHSAAALTNAQSHETLFLLPLWRLIGKSRVLVTARNLPKTILASIAILAAALAMWLLPWDFTLSADGRLLPEVRRNVFAAHDGMITAVLVEDGQHVTKGEVVARQRSLDLQNRIVELNGKIQANEESIAAVVLKRLGGAGRRTAERDQAADHNDLGAELARLEVEKRSLLEQRKLLNMQTRQLEAVSPIDGVVVTWKPRELLGDRPVKTGQRLMEIADPKQDWQVEVQMPESKMGHIVEYLREQQAKDPSFRLDATFILATHPSIKLSGQVKRIHASAEVVGEKNSVRMDVAFDQHELLKLTTATDANPDAIPTGADADAELQKLKDSLKVGADVKAKIHCGQAPVGYVLLHDAWEFLQSRVFFRF